MRVTCRDGTEATGGGASELSARSPMGLKWPDHTTRTQIHGEGSNTRKQSCKDVDSLPILLIQLSNTCTLPFGAQVLLRQTTHLTVFFLSLSGTVGILSSFFFTNFCTSERSTCEAERCRWGKRIAGTSLDLPGFSQSRMMRCDS